MNAKINRPTAERLSLYYHYLKEHISPAEATVSSQQIADIIKVDPTLVRKDMAAISLRGRPRAGFDIEQAKTRIREVLGFNTVHRTVLVGAGRLGSALAAYPEFRDYGLHILALFDTNPAKIGTFVGARMIYAMSELSNIVRSQNVEMGIITVPADTAQSVADQLVAAGVTGIWCFSATQIHTPANVVVRQEHLSAGLADILYRQAVKRHEQVEQVAE
ncbi:MAG: redox-sensing transcriptional repressor Rex [Sedimentisphaerales bacterium]|nr:redox-sensing transcriptional repressor Rex [Sedimentisphaerales bacterium]